jgi:uncharacterized membrane protein YqgA involved in biofilm formation
MIGTIVNTLCIIAGSAAGSLMRRGIKEKYRDVLFNAMGLASIALGCSAFVQNMPKSEYPVLFIISIALGGLIGSIIDLQARVDSFAARKGASRLAEGLTAACLLYCIGTFSIVGPMLAALKGDNTFLFTNSTLDLVTSTVFGASYGWGMVLAAPILFAWQGSIYLAARLSASAEVMQGPLLNELCIVGGLLIMASGLSILKIKDCKTLNFIPALFIPIIFYLAKCITL